MCGCKLAKWARVPPPYFEAQSCILRLPPSYYTRSHTSLYVSVPVCWTSACRSWGPSTSVTPVWEERSTVSSTAVSESG